MDGRHTASGPLGPAGPLQSPGSGVGVIRPLPAPSFARLPGCGGQSTGVSTQMASALRHVSPLEFTPSLAVLSEEQTLVQAYSGPPALGKGGRTCPRVRVPREGGRRPSPPVPCTAGGWPRENFPHTPPALAEPWAPVAPSQPCPQAWEPAFLPRGAWEPKREKTHEAPHPGLMGAHADAQRTADTPAGPAWR